MSIFLLNFFNTGDSNSKKNYTLKTPNPGYSLLFLILFFFTNCFEYEEIITFKRGFSGVVEIHYTVPINPRTGKSVIKFLPIHQEEIENRLNKGLFGKTVKISDYSLRILEKDEFPANPYFLRKAKVTYKMIFTDIASLDGLLMGNLFTKRRGNTLLVKREFRMVDKPLDLNSSSGEKKIRSETIRLLGEGYVQFRVFFPQSSECRSNLGEMGLGYLNYKLPLTETIEKSGNKIWDYSITTF